MEIKKKNIVKSLLLSSLALGLFATTNNTSANASTNKHVNSSKVNNNQKIIIIKYGDTVSDYAVKYNSTVKDIAEANHLENANLIYAGDKIIIPINSRAEGENIYSGWNTTKQGAGNVQAHPVAVNATKVTTANSTKVVQPVTPAQTAAKESSNVVAPVQTSKVQNVSGAQDQPASVTATTQTTNNPVSTTTASQAPASQAPASQAPASQAPASQAPASQAPASQAPASQTPASQTPASQTPASQTPASQTPASQTPASQTPASQTPTAFTPTESGVRAALQAKVASFGKPAVTPDDPNNFNDTTTRGTLSGKVTGDVSMISSDQQLADMLWDNCNASLIQNSLDQVIGLDLQSVSVTTTNGQLNATFTVAYQEK